jgi:sulfide:quinone oxidoreductase
MSPVYECRLAAAVRINLPRYPARVKRAVVLGGGFGGVAAAVALRRALDASDEVILVDRRADFVMGIRKTWQLLGIAPAVEGTRRLDLLREQGISVSHGEISSLDPSSRTAVVGDQPVEADALVVALGASHDPGVIPGLAEHGFVPWSWDSLPAATDAIAHFEGGTVAVGIFSSPYTCPPAPFELALLLQDHLAGRGIDASVSVFGPAPIVLPVLGAATCAVLDARLEERGIPYLAARNAVAVTQNRVEFTDGQSLAFDLLLAVPPHRAPSVLVEAGLASPGGWVAVDRATLETGSSGVYAIGDCTAIPLANGLPLPKAGLFAQNEGEAVAARIAAVFRGEMSTSTFDGSGACYLEMGGGEASTIRGDFYADPPATELTTPSAAQRAEKMRFESDRLERWFGA